MRSALAKVDGVEDIQIDYEAKTALVMTDGDVSGDQLVAAFEGTRYTASVR